MTILTRATDDAIRLALRFGGDTHSLEDIAQGIDAGRFQLWDGDASAIITEILSTPRRKTLHFFLAGGYLIELRAMVPGILEWGQSIGCTHASLVGRFGWLRSFVREFGFKEKATLMEAKL
jgi:hypothetical protein